MHVLSTFIFVSEFACICLVYPHVSYFKLVNNFFSILNYSGHDNGLLHSAQRQSCRRQTIGSPDGHEPQDHQGPVAQACVPKEYAVSYVN